MKLIPRQSIPTFETDEEIAEFWETHSLTDYWDETEEVDPDLFRDAEFVLVEADGTETPFKPRPAPPVKPAKTPRPKAPRTPALSKA